MKPVFGTMNYGQQVFGQDAQNMLAVFSDAGGVELDTAYVYNDGACEELLGECLKRFEPGAFSVATKANPRVTGVLDRSAVVKQLDESLVRMNLSSVDIFYLHFPDMDTPIINALEGCADLYAQGKFKELGVSNFPLALVEEMMPICTELGCPRPTVFEGVYNALSRKAEYELMPVLDRLGMRFYAYNPLAGGMLTGKYHDISEKPADGRFALRAKSYQSRYWKEGYFEAVRIVADACGEHGIPVAQAAYRWIANHSMLSSDRGDAVIIGASNMSQLTQNIAALSDGPLPREIASIFDDAWKLTSEAAPEYYRFYSGGRAV